MAFFPSSFSLNIYKLVTDSCNPDSLISNPARATLDEIKTFPLNIELKGIESGKIRFDTLNSGGINFFIGSAYHNMGHGFDIRDDLDKAIFAYRRALEFDPGRMKTYTNLIRALHGVGLGGDAAQIALQAVERNPNAPNGLLVNASLSLAASGKLENAISLTSRVLGNDPSSVPIPGCLSSLSPNS